MAQNLPLITTCMIFPLRHDFGAKVIKTAWLVFLEPFTDFWPSPVLLQQKYFSHFIPLHSQYLHTIQYMHR